MVFGRKKEVSAEKEENKRRITELRDFCAKGETFNYMGVEMMVTGHLSIVIAGFNAFVDPRLECEYVNVLGEIKQKVFDYSDLPMLKRHTENQKD